MIGKGIGYVGNEIDTDLRGDKLSSVNIASNDDLFFIFILDRTVFLGLCNDDVFIVGIVLAGKLCLDTINTCFMKWG